jgi:hypothetical protein
MMVRDTQHWRVEHHRKFLIQENIIYTTFTIIHGKLSSFFPETQCAAAQNLPGEHVG